MSLLQYLAHLDVHLLELGQQYGALAYLILFLIIFSETGLVIAPFLPGDTLLFVAGAVSALGTTTAAGVAGGGGAGGTATALVVAPAVLSSGVGGVVEGGGGGVYDLAHLWEVLALAALLGNQLNFQIGRWLGPRVFQWEHSRWFNPAYLAQAHAFYERHGGKTVILSRFLPIVRTYAPFVAGVAAMPRRRFLIYNALGAASWVGSLLLAGSWFGNVPWVRTHLTLIILGIVLVSLTPALLAFLRARAGSGGQG